MKRFLCLTLVLAMLFSMTACSQQEVVQDESPITMFIPLGNSESYYRAIADMVKEKLGYDVEFVYQYSYDTSDMAKLCFANNDLPADIVFTAAKTDNALLKDSCVDLLSRSSLTARFTPTTIQGCTTEDGAVYQLPITSRLIGITYNETLLQEMGWEVPKTFADMVSLKEKCDAAGIKFAVSDGVATGHGFNWLFHLMGSQWLSTPEGTEWLEGFQAGTRTIDEFKEACDYFKEWTEAGLWGSVHNSDWNGNAEFSKTRALFWFGLTNGLSGYDGPQYDDEGNEIGVELHDTYKSMPWISEDGSNNCYTYYDSCWVYVNKELEAPNESEKLKKVLEILELLTSDEATKLVSDMGKDTYVSVNNYEMGDDRLYAAYGESIKNGFVQPWYYNSFDTDSIVLAGGTVNDYITGKGSFDTIFDTLDKCNQNRLNAKTEVLAEFPDGLGYEDTAKLLALAGVSALDLTLEENGSAERVDAVLVPYTEKANQLQPWKNAPVCNSVVYKGSFDAAYSQTVIPAKISSPVGIYMTGAEIKEITEKGFDPADSFIDSETGKSTYDSEHYGPYPYVCLVKGGEELEDDKEYLVAIAERFLTAAELEGFKSAGKVLETPEDAHTYLEGLQLFAQEHPTIRSSDLTW